MSKARKIEDRTLSPFRRRLFDNQELLHEAALLRAANPGKVALIARAESFRRAISSRFSFEIIAKWDPIHRSRSFVARAAHRAADFGVQSLRDVSHGGYRDARALIKTDVGAELADKIANKTLRTSGEIQSWLSGEHDVRITRNGLYSWLQRNRLTLRPRKRRKKQ